MRREQAELVLAELLSLTPGGVEEVDVDEAMVEFAVYGAPGELPELPDVRAAAAGALVEVSTSEISDDWSERWRQFHKPLVLGDALTVRPPWEPSGATEVDVVIDPGRAFGTGAHATTRLVLELMLALRARGLGTGGFADVGCGSGVLAIVAARLGYAPVLALDNDPAALEAARSNVAANGVVVEVRRFDVRRDPVPAGYRTVAANLLAPLLMEWAGRMSEPPEVLIAGGLLVAEVDGVVEAFAARGLAQESRRELGEWAAVLLERAG